MNIWKGASLGNCQFKSLIDKWTSKTNISKLERRKDQEIVLTIFTGLQDIFCKMVFIFSNVLGKKCKLLLKKSLKQNKTFFFFSLNYYAKFSRDFIPQTDVARESARKISPHEIEVSKEVWFLFIKKKEGIYSFHIEWRTVEMNLTTL